MIAEKHSSRQRRTDYVPAAQKAKSDTVTELVPLTRRRCLSYDDFLYVCQQARKKLGLRRLKRDRKRPQLLSASELVNITIADIDLGRSTIVVDHGKGRKDRYILFQVAFRLVLKSHLAANLGNRYLFESHRCGPFTARRVQQIVQEYRERAGIATHVHRHLFRHQMLTLLTAQGLSDTKIQRISGHESKKSLEIYRHLSLKEVEQDSQDAVRAVRL